MKKIIFIIYALIIVLLCGCGDEHKKPLIIGVTADYPPFEFKQDDNLKGLDIDLARLIAKQLNKKIEFKEITHDKLFVELNANNIDLIISSISFTKERNNNFDLSNPYYFADMALIFKKEHPIQNINELTHKKVAVQLGTTMETWVRELFKDLQLITLGHNQQLIASIKANQADVGIIEYSQAKELCHHDQDLGYLVASKTNHGYVIVMRKGSKLLQPINIALEHIKDTGSLNKLEKQWLEVMVEDKINENS